MQVKKIWVGQLYKKNSEKNRYFSLEHHAELVEHVKKKQGSGKYEYKSQQKYQIWKQKKVKDVEISHHVFAISPSSPLPFFSNQEKARA